MVTCRQAFEARDRSSLSVAGLVLVRQRPGSAEGVVFMTLEDETATINVIIWLDMFERFCRVVLSGQMLGVVGRLQKEGEVVHLVTGEIVDLSHLLADVGNRSLQIFPDHDQGRLQETIVVKARNFH